MTIEASLYSHLKDDPDVGAIVVTRIYPGRLPQNPTYPAITYRRHRSPRINHVLGASAVKNSVFELVCYAKTYAAMRALVIAVEDALNGPPTAFKALTRGDSDEFNEETQTYQGVIEISLWH